jgi:hypothetical protein
MLNGRMERVLLKGTYTREELPGRVREVVSACRVSLPSGGLHAGAGNGHTLGSTA